MDFTLFFCADGILRAKWDDKSPLLPLSFIQEQSIFKDNDFKFWSRWWESNTFFEEGLTIANFLNALTPWSDFWSDMTGKDILAYIKESKKPTLVKDDKDTLSWACLFYSTDVKVDIEFEKFASSLEFDDDFDSFFNNPQKIRLSGDWEIYSKYTLSGYKKGVQEHYGIDSCPLNEIANLPLYLSNRHKLYIFDNSVTDILSENQLLLNNQAYGVRVATNNSKEQRHTIKYIEGNYYHNIRDIIEGFFYWFPSNPVHRQEIKEQIEQSLAALEIEKEDLNNTDIRENTEDKKLKVVVSPNAFDGLIESAKKDKSYWDSLIEKTKDSNVIPRIGTLKVGVTPESRVFGMIVEDKDLSTEYKLR